MNKIAEKVAIGLLSLVTIITGCSNKTSVHAKVIDVSEKFSGTTPMDLEMIGYEVIMDRRHIGLERTRDTVMINVPSNWSYRFQSERDHLGYLEWVLKPGYEIDITIPDSNLEKTNYSIDMDKNTVYDIIQGGPTF